MRESLSKEGLPLYGLGGSERLKSPEVGIRNRIISIDTFNKAREDLVEALNIKLEEQPKIYSEEDRSNEISNSGDEGFIFSKLSPDITEGKLQMDQSRLLDLLGASMYEKPIAEVSVKELLQNAFDTSKSTGATETNPKIIDVNINKEARTIEVKDSGAGMTPEIIQKAFFTVAGTYKEGLPENTSGGLGLAKMAFILGSKSLHLETIKDGRLHIVDTTASQVRNGTFEIHSSDTDRPNGTTVRVEIPSNFIDSNGETRNIYMSSSPDFLQQPLVGPVEIKLNGRTLPIGINLEIINWITDLTLIGDISISILILKE